MAAMVQADQALEDNNAIVVELLPEAAVCVPQQRAAIGNLERAGGHRASGPGPRPPGPVHANTYAPAAAR